MTRLFEVSVAEPFRSSLVSFLRGVVLEVEGSLASDDTDTALRERLPEYIEWASTCVGRIARSVDDYVSLDEMDMATLSRDVLPSMMARANTDMQAIIDGEYDKDALLAILRDMQSANTLCSRLFRIMSHDVFDEDFCGDRAYGDKQPAIPAS